MGAQHSSVGRTKSLDEATVQRLQNSSTSNQSDSSQVRKRGSIGDANGATSRLERGQRSKSTLVIVNRGSSSDPTTSGRLEDDPLFRKLEELPAFVPLMHEVETASNLWGVKNRALADIRSRIEPTPFIHIVRLYEDRLRRHAESITLEQGRLTKCIREIDINVTSIFKTLTQRQKKFAKHAENFSKLSDITHTLSKCQTVLKGCERNLQILNGLLPLEDRLEPFSWPGLLGEDDDSNSKNEDKSRSDNIRLRIGIEVSEAVEVVEPIQVVR